MFLIFLDILASYFLTHHAAGREIYSPEKESICTKSVGGGLGEGGREGEMLAIPSALEDNTIYT